MSDKFNNLPLNAKYIESAEVQSSELIYTVKEVASILKTNVDYIHSLRKAGLLPFLKLGQFKVRRQALIDFLCKYEGYDLTDPFYVKELNNG